VLGVSVLMALAEQMYRPYPITCRGARIMDFGQLTLLAFALCDVSCRAMAT
jgi:hypothetical protein